MQDKRITLLDPHRNQVATAQVERHGDRCTGSVNADAMPLELRAKFEKYEDLVNNQVFSLLDQLEEEIGAIPFTAVFEDGRETAVTDLQLYPKAGSIAFKTTAADVPALQP